MIRVIAIANQKGGCGKTTTTINLGACLARLNQRVLLVDMDPQAHTTVGLGIFPEKLDRTLFDLLAPSGGRRIRWEEVTIPINSYLFLAPGDLRLHELEAIYAQHPQREKQLKYLLFLSLTSGAYDFILIDCPPNLGFLTVNALEAAQRVTVPIEPSFFSLHGLAKICETLQRIGERRGQVHETRALLTLFAPGNSFSQEVYEEVKKYFQDRVFHTLIRENTSLREAAAAGLSIVDYDPHSIGYRDYMGLAREILERDWKWETLSGDGRQGEKGDPYIGPRRVSGGILFQMLAPQAKEICLVGDFNQWIHEPLLRRNGIGIWQRVIPVRRGGYRYKFLVDGEWQLDPGAPEQKINPYGHRDSYIEIGDGNKPI